MKEELNTQMHSEFSVDEKTDLRNRVFALLSEASRNEMDPYELADDYSLSRQQIDEFRQSYLDLLK